MAREQILINAEELKDMLSLAWQRGNKEGWEMNTDWPEHGDEYAEQIILARFRIKLNTEQNVQASVATDDHSSNEANKQNKNHE